jgi:serine/threonine protein kinase
MSQHDSSQDADFRPPSLEELAALLPQYELKDFLAQGGMGAVYLARQVSLDRLVAIKVLPPAWGADAGYAQLFQTEARAMAKMHHNHIVGVFDFGITTGGHFYLVMEYVPGQTLHDMIRLKKLPLAKVQGLVLQICDAVSYAHEHGVLHRDIKPGNVLVSSSGEVKIADFGLARHAGAAVEEESLGTPDYAAPELFQTGALVDHRADIFALGIVIQEMLTGKVPRRPREPLSAHGVFDPGWEPLIATATHENAARRFHTVRQLRDAVTNVTKRVAKPATVTGPAPGVPRGRPYVPPPAPEPPAFPWMSILGGLVVVAVAGTWWWKNRAEAPASPPSAPSAPVAVSPSTEPSPSPSTTPTPSSSSPATSTPSPAAKDKPFTPGAAFTLAPVPPGHVFKLPEGHKDVVYSLAVFPDQHHAATGSADGTVGVWDLQTGERIRTFGPVPGSVSRLAVSPDGRSIASSANDYKVTIWSMDAAQDSPPKELGTSARSASYLLFSDDGETLIIGTSDAMQSLLVWDWKKSTTAEVVPGLRSTVNGLDRAPGISQGAVVVSGMRFDAGQMTTELWVVDVTRRSLVRQLAAPPASLYRMKVTPDGRSGVALVSGRITTWDLESGAVLARSDAPTSILGDLELLDAGRLVLYGSQDRCLRIVETITAKDVWTSGPADTQCTNSAVSLSGGRYAVTAGGFRSGNPIEKDGDYALHTWALPDLATLQSGEAEKAKAKRQMLTLEKDDAELWTLLTKLAAEWAEKTAIDPAAGHKDLDEKYLTAVRREMSTASPRDREAFLSEISRIANGASGSLAAGAPQNLIRLHDIYQQQIALIPQKAQSARTELSTSHQAQLDALEKKRSGAADAPGTARVQLVRQALTELNGEMVLAKLQEHFLPKKPEMPSIVSMMPRTTVSSSGIVQSIAPGAPLPPATGDIPPYTSPRRGLTRPVSLHKVEVWPRNSNFTSVQSGISRIPDNLGPVVALAVGGRHALALKADGTVVQWGNEDPRILGVPEGLNHIVAIDAGSNVSACLRDDGVVIAWNNRQILTQSDRLPAVEVTATFSNVMARREDGSLNYIMGPVTSTSGVTTMPARSVYYSPPPELNGCIQVCAASGCAFALKKDGTVVGWGRSTQQNAINMTDKMPQQELVNGISIASLSDLGLMLKRTGEIVAWGQNVPAELSNRPRFPGATRIIGGRPYTGLAIGFQPGIWKFLSLSDNRYPIDTETSEQKARGCTEIGIGQYFILGLRPL